MNQHGNYQENDDAHMPIHGGGGGGGYPLRRASNVTSISISGSYMSAVLTTLKQILSEVECLTFTYQVETYPGLNEVFLEKFDFNLEYGTIPTCELLDSRQRQHHFNMKFVICNACDTALEWFPHNLAEMEADDADEVHAQGLYPRSLYTRKWTMSAIELYSVQTDDGSEIIHIDFNRQRGDRWTSFWIYKYVSKRIERDLIWETRKNYLAIFEGCQTAEGHIAHFLFDEYVARTNCTFMKMPKVWLSY